MAAKKGVSNQEAIIKQLAHYLNKKPEVVFAFLFGSFQKINRKTSDIDIAVYFTPVPDWARLNLFWLDLERITGRTVDLILLNQAKPTLAWSALRGRPLVIKNFRCYLSFFLHTSQEAEDARRLIFDFWRWQQKIQKAS